MLDLIVSTKAADFLAENHDFLALLIALAYLLIAFAGTILLRNHKYRQIWVLLSLFCILRVAHHGLCIVSEVVPASMIPVVASWCFSATAGLVLIWTTHRARLEAKAGLPRVPVICAALLSAAIFNPFLTGITYVESLCAMAAAAVAWMAGHAVVCIARETEETGRLVRNAGFALGTSVYLSGAFSPERISPAFRAIRLILGEIPASHAIALGIEMIPVFFAAACLLKYARVEYYTYLTRVRGVRLPWMASPAVLALVASIVLGFVGVNYAGLHQNQQMRAALLARTKACGAALNAAHISGLTGTNADLSSPEFVRLQEQCRRICDSQSDLRFIYLLRRNVTGEIVFVLSSQPSNVVAPDEWYPGEPYDDASEELDAAFTNRQPFVEGPISDDWGTWVSGLAPLVDDTTGQIPAVLGMDIDAGLWMHSILVARIEILSMLSLVILLILMFAAGQSRFRATLAQVQTTERISRTIIENSPAITVLLDASGRIISINTAGIEALGKGGADTLRGQPFAEIWPSGRRKSVETYIRDSIQGKPLDAIELDHEDETGVNRTFELVLNRVRADQDNRDHGAALVGILRDVTEMRLAARASERMLMLAIALGAEHSASKAFERITREVCDISGVCCAALYLRKEDENEFTLATFESYTENVHFPSSLPEHSALVNQLGRNDLALGTFHDLAPEADPPVSANIAAFPIYCQSEVTGALLVASLVLESFPVYVRNVLETLCAHAEGVITRDRAERSIHGSEQNLKNLFNSIEDFLFIIDESGHILDTNEAACRRLGYTADQLKSMTILELHPPDRLLEVAPMLASVLTRETFTCSTHIQTAQGEELPVETRVVCGRWNNEDVLFGISRDVTERVEIETKLKDRERLLDGVAMAASFVLTSTDFGSAVTTALEVLGNAVKADRVFVFENVEGIEPGGFTLSRQASWARVEDPSSDSLPLFEDDPLSPVARRWYDILAVNEPVRTEWANLTQDQQKALASSGIRSLLLLPITVEARFWGFIAFGMKSVDHHWSDLEVSILTAAAGILGGSFVRRMSEEKLLKINDCFLQFGDDPLENINRLTALCGRLLNGAVAFYQRLDSGLLRTVGSWNTRHDHPALDKPEGYISHEIIVSQRDETMLYRGLQYSKYGSSDPSVIEYGLHTYLGKVVRVAGQRVGALSVMYKRDHASTESDQRILSILASAAGIEEERRLAQEALRQLEYIVNQSPVVVCRWRIDTSDNWPVELVSENIKHFGYDPEDFYSNRVRYFDIVHPDDRGGVLAEARREQRQGVSEFRMEYRIMSREGDVHWLDARVWVLRNPHGDATHYQGILIDMTERKKMEETIRTAKEQAESVNVELEKAIARANRLALEASAADMAKSQFLANMSHEIRTPMNGVLGMAELMQSTSLTRQQREYLDTIRTCGENLMSLINDILDFSKIEAGKLEIVPAPVNLLAIVESVAQLLASRANDKGIELVTYYSPTLPWDFVGDSVRLTQIITNLVGNAIKFTKQGHVMVEVLPRKSQDAEKAALSIRVVDTGIGIAPDRLDDIFGEFTQADSTTTREFGGTGLGLAITKRLTELMGGDIIVTSETGKGSVFDVRIALPLDTESSKAPEKDDLPRLRVLIVDDNPVNRRYLSDLLLHWGLDCTVSATATEALDLLAENQQTDAPFQVALIDLHLPGMDGLALARAVKGSPGLADTRLVLLASQGAVQTLPSEFLVSADKPVRQHQLREAVRAAWFGVTDDIETSQARSGDQLVPPNLTSARILVVEDTEVNQKVLLGLMAQWGWKPDVANNGAEAVEKFSQNDYDLILMDCQMPVMDGFEAARRIREMEGGQTRVPIVAMTARAMRQDREQCLAAGMDDHVAKPIKGQIVRETIIRMLQNRPQVSKEFAPRVYLVTEKNHLSFLVEQILNAEAMADVIAVEDLAAIVERFVDDDTTTLVLDILAEGLEKVDVDGLLESFDPSILARLLILAGLDTPAERIRKWRAYGVAIVQRPIDKDVFVAAVAEVLNRFTEETDDAEGALEDKDLSALPEAFVADAEEPPHHEAAGPESPDSEVFDLAQGLSATADNFELLREVIEAFMEDFDARYETLQKAVRQKDAKAVTEVAHALKGTSGTIGAAAVSKKSALVETLGKQNNLDDLGTLPEEIGEEFARFTEVVASFAWPES